MIGLQVHGVPDSQVFQGCLLPGVGDDGEAERRSIGRTFGHREADPIHRDAGLLTDVTAESGIRPADRHGPGVREALQVGDFTGGIHMTTHQMTTKAVAQAKRWLEVHRSPTVRLASQRGAAQGLLTHIGAETIRHQLCRREADAIHSHTVAEG